MRKLTIQNEGRNLVGFIPETWAELKVKHFLLLESDFSEADFIASFMDLPKEDIENITGDLRPVIRAIEVLFSNKPPDFKDAKKEVLELEGKKLQFPKSLNFTRYGQKSLLKNLMQKETPIEQEISTIFAIYAQPLIDGKFDSTRIEAIKLLVDELPIIQVYPYVLFFFKKSSELKRHFQTLSRLSLQP